MSFHRTTQLGTTEIPSEGAAADYTTLDVRVAKANVRGMAGPWFRATRDTRVLANLAAFETSTATPAGPMRSMPVQFTTTLGGAQPNIRPNTPVVLARLVGDCPVSTGRNQWGLDQTCELSGGIEVVRDFPLLRRLGFLPVATIDSAGHFVMGWMLRAHLIPMAVPAWVAPYMAKEGGPPPALPSVLPWETPPPRMVPQPAIIPGPLPMPQPDVTVPPALPEPENASWGGVVIIGLALGAAVAVGAAVKAAGKTPAAARQTNPRRRRSRKHRSRRGAR